MELDELEEDEMTESSSDSSEEEDIEEDIIIKDKPRKKSAFADDEAEVSDEENADDINDVDEEMDADDNDETSNEAKIDNNSDDEEKSDDDDDDSNEAENKEKRPLKRIVMPENDSDSENEFNEKENDNKDLKKSLKDIINGLSDESNDSNKNKQEENEYLHDTISLPSDEDEIPLYQHENLDKTPSRITQSKSQFNLTPISCLSALQWKSTTKAPILESPINLPLEPSPLRKNPGLKTKLFENPEPTSLTQAFEELENLCSGKFTADKTEDGEKISQDLILEGISGNILLKFKFSRS